MSKIIIFCILLSLFFSCKNRNTDSAYENTFVAYETSVFEVKNNLLLYKGNSFSGTVYQLFENVKDTLKSVSYLNGLQHGVTKKWYSPNQLLEKREYLNGKKNGHQIAFWFSGKKRFEFNAIDDKYEGKLEQWDVNGNLTQLGNFKNGQEEGEQKMWTKDGKVRSNYIIKNGRRYGLLGTKNCVNVTDSIELIK